MDTNKHVRQSLSKLRATFSAILRKLVRAQDVTLRDLKCCVHAVSSPLLDPEVPKPLLSAVHKQEFIHSLKMYCSAQNPTVLQQICQNLSDGEAKTKMNEYFREYLKFQSDTKLKDLAGNFDESDSRPPPQYMELELVLREIWHERNLKYLEKIKNRLSQKLWLMRKIEGARGSTILITFLVPNSENLQSCENLKDYLDKVHVQQLTMGGKFMYKGEEMNIN